MAYARNNQDPANAMPVWVVSGSSPIPPGAVYLSYEQIAVDDVTPVPLTPPAGAIIALVQVESVNVRYTRTAPAPTTTSGMVIWGTSPPMAFDVPATTLKFISMSGSGKLNVEYYGTP